MYSSVSPITDGPQKIANVTEPWMYPNSCNQNTKLSEWKH